MIVYKIVIGLLKRDPRFNPLDKTAIPFYDRVMEIVPSLNRKAPSRLSKLIIQKHYLSKYRFPFHSQIEYIKVLK